MTKRNKRCGRRELLLRVCLDGWPAALRLAFLEGMQVVGLAVTVWLVGRPR